LADYEKEANKWNRSASSAKGFKYPPVLPIVFYDGPYEWTAETNFLNRTELNDVFEKYIPKFEYELVDLNKYSEQDIARFGNALSLIMIIDKLRKADGTIALKGLPADYTEKLRQSIPPHLDKLLTDVITVLLKRINVPDAEIAEVTERLHQRRIQEMFAFFDNYDVQETRRVARAEGRAEGANAMAVDIAKNMLRINRPLDEIIKVTGLPREEVESLRGAD
jgi:predicted transposase/invertase (TIGR01784 family)